MESAVFVFYAFIFYWEKFINRLALAEVTNVEYLSEHPAKAHHIYLKSEPLALNKSNIREYAMKYSWLFNEISVDTQ